MTRVLIALLLTCLLGVATGAVQYVHENQHASHHHDVDHDHEAPAHDESHCTIHATLAAPAISVGYVPLLVSLGLLVAFLTELPQRAHSRHPAFRIDCRGPPACA